MRNTRLTVLMAAMAVASLSACSALGKGSFKQPVVTFKDAKVRGLGLTGGSIDIVLNVYNPNGYRLDATRLTYKLMVDSIPFGDGATDQHFTVNSGDSTSVTLPLNFSYTGLSSAGRSLLDRGTVNYRVLGDLTVGTVVGNYTIPYDRTGRFSTFGGAK